MGNERLQDVTLAERLAAEAKDWDGVTLATLGQSESRRLHALLAEAAAALAAPPAESQPQGVEAMRVCEACGGYGFTYEGEDGEQRVMCQACNGSGQPPAPAVGDEVALHRFDEAVGVLNTRVVYLWPTDYEIIRAYQKRLREVFSAALSTPAVQIAAPGDVELSMSMFATRADYDAALRLRPVPESIEAYRVQQWLVSEHDLVVHVDDVARAMATPFDDEPVISTALRSQGQADAVDVEVLRAFERKFWQAVKLTDSRDFDHDVCKEVRDFRDAIAALAQQANKDAPKASA